MSDERYPVALGAHVGAVEPGTDFEPSVEFTREKLVEMLTQHRPRARKDGPYITRPMGGNGTRSDSNALPWRLVPVDVDELHPSEFPALVRWCEESKIAGCLATTFSHKPEQPKVRIWFFASRDITAPEHAFVHQALERLVPFKLDPCMLKPSQPAFLPSCPTENINEAHSAVMQGEPLDVDLLLDSFRDEIEEQTRRRAERAQGGAGTGVRQPGGLLDYFNQNYPLRELLEKHGYKRKSHNRYIAPSSKSRRAAVVLYERSVISFHDPAHDPIARRNKYGQAMVLDSFSALCILEHADDFKAGFNGALKWSRAQGWVDTGASAASASSPAPSAPPPMLLNPEELYSNLKPQDMLIEGILDSGAVVIVAGDSNSGKTTVTQYLALQVAMGQPFGTHRTRAGRVLWIAGEDMDNAKYRVVAMCEEYGIDPRSIGDQMLLLPQPVAVLHPESMEALRVGVEQRCGEGAELALVVIDSKSVNWGGTDENSNDENAQFILAVRKHLIDPFGKPAVLITHHLTKQKEKEARSSRGGSALINNADHEWRFEMNQEAHLSAMLPGSKVRIERWAEQRFLIKTVELPKTKFPHLLNNFGEMPRVSIAEPVNQYNRSMKQLQLDADLRAVLMSMERLRLSGKPCGQSHVAADLNWADGKGAADYRKVKRILDRAVEQKLALREGKEYALTPAGIEYAEQEGAIEDAHAEIDEER